MYPTFLKKINLLTSVLNACQDTTKTLNTQTCNDFPNINLRLLITNILFGISYQIKMKTADAMIKNHRMTLDINISHQVIITFRLAFL